MSCYRGRRVQQAASWAVARPCKELGTHLTSYVVGVSLVA